MAEPRTRSTRCGLVAGFLLFAPAARASDAFQVSGFVALRGATHAGNPFEADRTSAQVQAGIDWSPSPRFLAHVHLLARTDDGESRRGHAGTPEAYLETHLPVGGSRVRLRAGAFFLPTSRENVDALWENPYALSSSALNSWFGEEFRPIGLDASWTRGQVSVGATAYRGNDTFGALPLEPGWSLHDRWIVLGQEVRTGKYLTSVSAETDHHLGWSARAGWSTPSFTALVTHIDNRSDGLLYGELYNWNTRFHVVGLEYRRASWTFAGETGWGPTILYYPGGRVLADLRASYVLASRLLGRGRATARFDAFSNGTVRRNVVTVAGFWTPAPRFTVGLEFSIGGSARRGLSDLRYRFSGP